MKVLLVTSPHVKHSEVLRHGGEASPDVTYFFAPLGLLSLAAALREQTRHSTDIFDLNRAIACGNIPLAEDFYESAADRILAHGPDIVGFMTECDSYHHVLQIVEQIKRREPGCYVVLGGPHASAVARETLSVATYVDAIVRGEGEKSFPRLVLSVEKGTVESLPGVVRRDRDGQVVDGGATELIENLDDLPMPAYDLYMPDPGEELFLEVGRGCPFQCTFCSTAPYWGRRHRVKSPQRIVREITELQTRFGTRRIHFTHDLFTTDRRWVKSFCDYLVREKVRVRWTCSARTDTVDPGLLQVMANAGCSAIYFGLESGSDRLLHGMRKNVPVERSLEVLRACQEVGITPNAGFIVGFPGEDHQSLADTLSAFTAALEIGVKPVHLFAFCPFADSSIYPRLQNLVCSGHFVDLPLGRARDEQNRQIIAANRTLFASYFRPSEVDLPDGVMAGIDEFSPLVEAALLPSLLLARELGGMPGLVTSWLSWISARNRRDGIPGYRRYYGSAVSYLEYCEEQLSALGPEFEPAAWYVRALARNNAVAYGRPPTAMATYRSLPAIEPLDRVPLSTPLSAAAVVDLLDVPCDLTAWFDWLPGKALPGRCPGRTRLAWYRLRNLDRVQLANVDATLFKAIADLRLGVRTPADMIVSWSEESPEGWNGDFDLVLEKLTSAVQAGLLSPCRDEEVAGVE